MLEFNYVCLRRPPNSVAFWVDEAAFHVQLIDCECVLFYGFHFNEWNNVGVCMYVCERMHMLVYAWVYTVYRMNMVVCTIPKTEIYVNLPHRDSLICHFYICFFPASPTFFGSKAIDRRRNGIGWCLYSHFTVPPYVYNNMRLCLC